MPARDLSRWTQNEDGSWRMNPTVVEQPVTPGKEERLPSTAGDLPTYSEMTLVQLRDELISRGLSKYGNKPELIARLQEDDELS